MTTSGRRGPICWAGGHGTGMLAGLPLVLLGLSHYFSSRVAASTYSWELLWPSSAKAKLVGTGAEVDTELPVLTLTWIWSQQGC